MMYMMKMFRELGKILPESKYAIIIDGGWQGVLTE